MKISKSWLAHLNQALYDTNRFVFRVVGFYAGVFLFSIAFMAAVILPTFLFFEHEGFVISWVLSFAFVAMWGVVTVMLKNEQEEPEVIEDWESDEPFLIGPMPPQRTWKEAATEGFKKTLYGLFLLIVPLFILAFFTEE